MDSGAGCGQCLEDVSVGRAQADAAAAFGGELGVELDVELLELDEVELEFADSLPALDFSAVAFDLLAVARLSVR